MNNFTKIVPIISAAGLAGVAGFAFANSQFSAALDGDVILGVGAALAIVGVAIFDYSRRTAPLSLPAPVLRPRMPAKAAHRASPQFTRHRADRLVA